MTALLEIRDLHVAYGKVEAVRGVGLTMQPGQIVTVIGPNGAGKTTLLAAAAGLLRSRGQVIYDGLDVERLDVEERVERILSGAGNPRIVRRHDGCRQPFAGRLHASP
jgi:branched-chain amino acid transport system ATP-binding protein